ncbi:MAG: acetolactate synthase, large subunit, biosynthetic type [Clostridiales bacterium 38-18]|nr:MAG: acetolactate synthase, large subunit, biosynthetic type [Clostridiales bacterium 38-18]
MRITGADIVLETLIANGVEDLFGFPGGAVIPIYDAIYQRKDKVKHYRTCHEQGAVHAADGYARATGKVGVCIVTSGPGATNTITGIATAFMDSSPVLILSGQVSSALIGRDSFQEVDITAMTITITKHCEMVKKTEEIAAAIERGIKIALEGRPGPVLIDIPKDLLTAQIPLEDFENYLKASKENSNALTAEFDDEKSNRSENETILNQLKDYFRTAKSPVLLVGGGVIHAGVSEKLTEWAIEKQFPVANTLMGSGAFPQSHPLSLGLIGMHGHAHANHKLQSADLVIALGVRFSDRVVGAEKHFLQNATIVQIDLDANELGKNKEVTFPWQEKLETALSILIEASKEFKRTPELFEIVSMKNQASIVENALQNKPSNESSNESHLSKLKAKSDQEDQIIAEKALKLIHTESPKHITVVTEVGQHQMWTAQFFGFDQPRQFITSGGLGTMGFGLGAAIGASIALKKRVLHIAGDGSFKMNSNELETVSKYKLPITTVIVNNHALGMVRQWQHLFCDSRYSETDAEQIVDFVKLAKAYGIVGFRVEHLKDLEIILKGIKDTEGPVLIECDFNIDEGVYPIIPPGKGVQDMIEEAPCLQ